jgi:hypothetical protein
MAAAPFLWSGRNRQNDLLRVFAQSLDPARCIYLDGYSGFRSPEDFLHNIRRELSPYTETPNAGRKTGRYPADIDVLNEYALTREEGIVLFLDTFEQYEAIEDWLRNHFVSRLSQRVKVITAGRYPLMGGWRRGVWNMLVHNVELSALSFAEMDRFIRNRGIVNGEMVKSLARFSKGVPLALSLACEIVVRNGDAAFLDQAEQRQMSGYLARELTRDIRDPVLKRYIEAASVLWKFDQELLQEVIQDAVPSDRFREFCTLPFVIRHEHGWSLHDSVRQWIHIDFRSRMPKMFRQFRVRALEALRERELENPGRTREYTFEKLFLSEDEFVRKLCFLLDDSLVFRPCAEDELEQVERLYVNYLRSQPNYIPGDVHLESLIRPLWRLDPEAFFSLWMDDRLVAFCACIRLTDETVRMFRSHPLTAPAVSVYDPGEEQYLVCLSGVKTRHPRHGRGIFEHVRSELLQVLAKGRAEAGVRAGQARRDAAGQTVIIRPGYDKIRHWRNFCLTKQYTCQE